MPDQLTINWTPPANWYIYDADLYCPDCASNIEHDLIGRGMALCQGMNDSNTWPQEYSSIGVGETDSPDHCGNCHRFLGRDLTEHGVEYVKQSAIDELARDGAIGEVVQGWLDYYGYIKIGTCTCSDESDDYCDHCYETEND